MLPLQPLKILNPLFPCRRSLTSSFGLTWPWLRVLFLSTTCVRYQEKSLQMKSTSNALLDLEGGSKSSFSSFESKLLICNGGSDLQSQISKLNPTIKKPEISSTSQSQVLDKVKNSWECYKKQTKNWRLMQRKILKSMI